MEDKGVPPTCHVCNGTDYYLQAGFYYCTECHTQSLGYRETIVDYQPNAEKVVFQRRSVKIKTPKEKKQKVFFGKEVQWTSWEGHNFVLKGFVDELISLGARPELKDIALQLWVKYLRKLEVAFTSTTHQLLPKFGLNQTAKDYMVIYGEIKEKTKRLRKLLLKNKSSGKKLERLSNDTTMTPKCKFMLAKRLCFKVAYEQIMAELASSQDILTQIDERLKLMAAAQTAKTKKKTTTSGNSIVYNESAKVALEKLKAKRAKRKGIENEDEELENETDEDEERQMEDERQMRTDKYYLLYSSCFDSRHLTRQKVLALLALALVLTRDEVQISDLLRWIKEGHLSYYKVSQFFPEGVKFGESDVAFTKTPANVRYKSLETCVADVASLIGLESFPVPDYAGLARRYVCELELPGGLACLASRLMAACGLGCCDGPVSHEALAMASVLVVLKTLLGLDGLTEHRISAVAAQINSLIDKDEERQLDTKLFVWDDWVRYIVCRRSIIMNEHFPTRCRCETELSTPSVSYVDWWSWHEEKDPDLDAKKETRKSRYYAHNNRIANMQMAADALPDSTANESSLKCAPSLTPQSSYLQAIRSRWSEDGSTGYGIQPTTILSYMHTLTDIEYLVQPTRIINFARSKGVTVNVEKSRALQEVEVEACVVRGAIRLPKSQGSHVVMNIEPWLDVSPSKPKANPKESEKGTDIDGREKKSTTRPPGITEESAGMAKNVAGCSQSSTVSQRAHVTSAPDGGDDTSTYRLTLNAPYAEYWVYDVHPRQPEGYFETKIEPDLPDSFRWLLNECSKVLEMRTVDLYAQVRLLERLSLETADLSELKLACPAINAANRSVVE